MSSRVASCSCGQLRLTCEGEPVRVSICHCVECQRRTGSAFGAQGRWAETNVKVEGTATLWSRVADSGNTVQMRFCTVCGSTTHWTLSALPGFVAVALGAFADATFPPPGVSVYDARRHPWVKLPDDIEHID